ncbi:MAG: 4-hydroxy-tetrahydrodipicolinate reductase [Verrucomicrobia bacterium]|nr:4-hydroxy-tetrahydrodipicolinate reductase [Verrucomicrobiota bacterium]MBS0637744.1 4-hydroxy-tetrahydrodipicolinate reductase [Verrucomicrobiota bacterium]
MGKLIAELAPRYDVAISGIVAPRAVFGEVVCYNSLTDEAIESCDIAIDFSTPRDIVERLQPLIKAKKPIVVGTTGWEKQEKELRKLVHDHHAALLYSPNFSLGVALFARLVSYASHLFAPFQQYDVGMMEMHHRQKQDAPSGTAIALAAALMEHYPHRTLTHDLAKSKGLESEQVHLASYRSGYHPGTHEVIFDSTVDTVQLTHRARNREGFAQGALEAAYWLIDKKGFYTLEDMIEEKISRKPK